MKYAVVVRSTATHYYIEIPDFGLSWEYPISPVDRDQAELRAKLKVDVRRRLMESLQGFIDSRVDIPEPSATPKALTAANRSSNYRAKWVSVPSYQALKVSAYKVWIRSGITQTKLANAIGLSRMGVQNLFKLDVMSELRNITAIIEYCGYELRYELVKKEEK